VNNTCRNVDYKIFSKARILKRQSHHMKKYLIYSAMLVLTGCGYVKSYNQTNVSFQSSDGKWADTEMQFYSRSLEDVVGEFEIYKIRCNVQNVTLQRTTKRPSSLSIKNTINNYDDLKWRIPYAQSLLPIAQSHNFPPVTDSENCFNKGRVGEDLNPIFTRTKEYLEAANRV